MDSVLRALRTDLSKYYRIHFGTESPTPLQRARLWVEHQGLHCVGIYRFAQLTGRIAARHRSLRLTCKAMRWLLTESMAARYHVHIDADIGPGFYIGHVGTIYITAARVGQNFSVTHNVTVGVGHGHRKEGVPSIGDNVWVGTASVIAGAIDIGDGATVANGTIVSRNVPSGCLIVGNPGRLVLREYDNASLLRTSAATQPDAECQWSERGLDAQERTA